MNSKIQILLALTATVTGSFLQSQSNHFQSNFNSTFLAGNDRIFKPIIVKNLSEHSKTKMYETQRPKTDEPVVRKILQPESAVKENYLNEKPETSENPFKFSSRYSTKEKPETRENGNRNEDEAKSSEIPYPSHINQSEVLSKSEFVPVTETHKSFQDRSDDYYDSEERVDSDEQRDSEDSEATPITKEAYSGPTSYLKNHIPVEETVEDSSQEDNDEEGKRSVEDYSDSSSKNYHSIQTPLSKIKYQGPLFFGDGEKTRPRLINSIGRHPIKHFWPYSKSQLKSDREKLNELSETYKKDLDEEILEEVKKPKQDELELAVEKDEFKFDRNRKYNSIDERNRMKQRQEALAVEEEKDDKEPLFQSLKQYQVKEKKEKEPRLKTTGNFKNYEVWSTTPEDQTADVKKPKKTEFSNELKPDFQGRQFLGPIVFDRNAQLGKSRQVDKEPVRSIYFKGLLEKEKLDQENLSNSRFQKSVFEKEAKRSQSFNHLEESNEMYNAILANIQSVFGLRTQPLKSGTRGKGSEVRSDESQSFTWSLPPIERERAK